MIYLRKKMAMMKFFADLNTHTIAAGNLCGEIQEMAQAAAERNLQILGISEQVPCDPGDLQKMDCAMRTSCGVGLIYGCEISVRNDGMRSLADSLKGADYAAAAIHPECFRNQGMERNTDLLIACMQHTKVRMVSHAAEAEIPLDYPRLVQAARDLTVAFEVSSNPYRNPEERSVCFAHYRSLLELCQKKRVPIVVSSDAYDPCQVGEMGEAGSFLEELDFDRSLILNLEGNQEKFIFCFRLNGICFS